MDLRFRGRAIDRRQVTASGLAIGIVLVSGVYGSCASGPPPGDYEQALRESREVDGPATAGGETAHAEARDAAAPADGGPDPDPEPEPRPEPEPLRVIRGRASYYADSLAGNPTASGEPYDPSRLTAASRDLPFGTRVRVVRVDNGRSVVVRINDRGPFNDRSRVVDLSRAAAEALDMIRAGVVRVRVEVLSLPEG